MRRFSMVLAVVGSIGAAYFLWASYRIDHLLAHYLIDQLQPAPFPYPDRWLLALSDYYDRRYPPSPGCFKVDSELERVRVMVLIGFFTSVAIGAVPLVLRFGKSWIFRPHGFPVIPMNGTKGNRPLE